MELVIGIAIAVVVLVALVFALVRRRGTADVAVPAKPAKRAPAPAGLRDRLGSTRRAIGGRLNGMLGGAKLAPEFWHELEESLIAADMGVDVASEVVAGVRRRVPEDGTQARAALVAELSDLLAGRDRGLHTGRSPAVVLIVGVNGAGKTTTIAKLAANLKQQGRSVLLGSADTFRAAADTQLRTWADRVGVPVVGGGGAADPASVAFDAYQSATARNSDVLIIDTAGRLQAKTNLMEELAKIARILQREAGSIDEVLLIVDGTAGQNALSQARAFSDAVGVTGLVLTKLDGSARGGIAIAIERQLDIPVKFIGVGEGIDHLVEFDPGAFVDALVGE